MKDIHEQIKEQALIECDLFRHKESGMLGFCKGGQYMVRLYNGISPETVKEMLEALKAIDDNRSILITSTRDSTYKDDIYGTLLTIRNLITKAETELNTK